MTKSFDLALAIAERGCFWLVLYLFGFLGVDVRWVTLAVSAVFLIHVWRRERRRKSLIAPTAEDDEDPASPLRHADLPAWALHPDAQRSEWTNVVLRQLWPHCQQLLRQTLRNVETDSQIKETLRGFRVASLKFPQVSLGKVAPKLSGVKVHRVIRRSEIILDAHVQYFGDLHVRAEVTMAGLPTNVPPVKASITNVSFSGVARYVKQLKTH